MSSPLSAWSPRDTASSTAASSPSPSRSIGTFHWCLPSRKRSGVPNRAEICWLAWPASSPPTLIPAMRTPFSIVRGEPAEGAIATAAKRTRTSESAARFQSAIRTNEVATLFTTWILRSFEYLNRYAGRRKTVTAFPARQAGLVTAPASEVGQRLPGLRHELPVVAPVPQRQLQNAKGVVVADLAVRLRRRARERVVNPSAGADHELRHTAIE